MLNRCSRRTPGHGVRRILLVRKGYVGDVIQTTALLRDLREHYPEAHITYMTGPGGATVLEGNTCVDVIEPFVAVPAGRARGLLPFMRRMSALRGKRFDLGIALNPDSRDALLLHLVGAKRTVGFAEPGREFLLDECVLWDETKIMARQDHYDALLRLLGKEPACRRYEFTPSAAEGCSRTVKALLEAPERIVVVAPGGGHNPRGCAPYRQWPAERFAEAAGRLIAGDNGRAVIVGGREDAEVAGRALEAWPAATKHEVEDLTDRTTLYELGRLLARADILITNDSAPVWIAAAVDCPTVCIVGCNHPVVCRPLSGSFVAVSAGLPCCPCFRGATVPTCPVPPDCLDAISVDQVVGAVGALPAGAGVGRW